jgi:ABC-type proline/glycine betaine transport system permease subunit
MPAFIKRWFINWATSLLGASAGGVLILEGLSNDDYSKVVQGVLMLLLGLFAKDSDVTGGKTKQE